MIAQLNTLATAIFENAKKKGWYDNGKAQNIGERIALIHSECSEALEADREDRYTNYTNKHDKNLMNISVEGVLRLIPMYFKEDFEVYIKDTFEDEMADIIIRVLDMCALKNIDIEAHIQAKMRYNELRPKQHGGKKY